MRERKIYKEGGTLIEGIKKKRTGAEREMVIETIEEEMMRNEDEMVLEKLEVGTKTLKNRTEESEEMTTGKEATRERILETRRVAEEKTEGTIGGMTGGAGTMMREIEAGMSGRRGREVIAEMTAEVNVV